MIPRLLVEKTLEFDKPARIPRELWVLGWAEDHYPKQLRRIMDKFPNDIVKPPDCLRLKPKTVGEKHREGEYIDEWGCCFVSISPGHTGEVKKPLIEDWSELSRLKPPEEMLSVDIDKVNEFCRNTDKFVIGGCCPRPFERLQFIRTSENLYIDLAESGPHLMALLKKVHDFYVREMEIWASTEVDALMFMDDWGAQRSLLISPELWRRLFKSLYQDYIEIAHARGKYAFMHSDGYILDIIPDLVEIGLDALNSQIFCMGVEELGKRFAGKLTFWGEIDRQHLLPYGSREDIFRAVELVRDSLYRDGGVIAQCEFGPGANPDNVYAVYEAWERLGGG